MRFRSAKWFLILAPVVLIGAAVGAMPSSAQYGPYPSYSQTYPSSATTDTATTTAATTTTSSGSSSVPAKKASGPTVHILGSNGSYRFSPKKSSLNKGTTLHWSWSSDHQHNVTFNSLKKHSKTTANGSFALRFNKKGTYHYMCTIHGFTGTVVVK